MSWLLPRILAGVLATAIGGIAGFLLGHPMHAPALSMLLGAVCGVAGIALLDSLRGKRLLGWLRSPQADPAPRDTGFWGEIGYRVERSIRARELRITQEETRLAQFLSAIEASPNGVLLIDAADQIEWCNSVAADHFALDPERDRRQRVTNLVRAPAFVARLQSEQEEEPFNIPRPRGNGTLSVSIRSYGEGMKLVLSQDITEREMAEVMRRDFVANVSHEIRTPLTVLSGFIETLTNLPLTEVERKRVLTLMSQQTQRMQTLVGDLLTLAQLEGSPRPPADRWVDVGKLINGVEVEARSLSAGRHDLNFQMVSGAQVAGAEAELQSALANLVNNAVRYTPTGGRVDVTWRVLPDGAGEFAVRDTGLGIEREHLPRLTERFYRVDGSRSRDTGGTGLGLSIVKHVVQRHGAEFDVQSELGKGSLFRFMLPPARVRTRSASAQEPTAAAPAAPLSVPGPRG